MPKSKSELEEPVYTDEVHDDLDTDEVHDDLDSDEAPTGDDKVFAVLDIADFADLKPATQEELTALHGGPNASRGKSLFALLSRVFLVSGMSSDEALAKIKTYMVVGKTQQIKGYAHKISTDAKYHAASVELFHKFKDGLLNLEDYNKSID